MANIYVSAAAGGGGDGSSGSPYTQAEAAALTWNTGGDTVLVQPGTYTSWTNATNDSGADGEVVWKADGGTVTINLSAQMEWTANGHVFEGLEFHWTSGSGQLYFNGATGIRCVDCVFDNQISGRAVNANSNGATFIRCNFKATSGETATGRGLWIGCTFEGDGGTNNVVVLDNGGSLVQCVVAGNGTSGAGIHVKGTHAYPALVSRCSVYDVAEGVEIVAIISASLTLHQNAIYTCSTYGISFTGTNSAYCLLVANAIGNTTTARLNGLSGVTEIAGQTLTASPWTNAATGDFTLNSTAGGGLLCDDEGYVPPSLL